jgi:hypothetical protein
MNAQLAEPQYEAPCAQEPIMHTHSETPVARRRRPRDFQRDAALGALVGGMAIGSVIGSFISSGAVVVLAIVGAAGAGAFSAFSHSPRRQ